MMRFQMAKALQEMSTPCSLRPTTIISPRSWKILPKTKPIVRGCYCTRYTTRRIPNISRNVSKRRSLLDCYFHYSPERIALLAKYAGGFWYVVSRTGVTGTWDDFSHKTDEKSGNEMFQIFLSHLRLGEYTGTRRNHTRRQIWQWWEVLYRTFLRDDRPFWTNLSEAENFFALFAKAPSAWKTSNLFYTVLCQLLPQCLGI